MRRTLPWSTRRPSRLPPHPTVQRRQVPVDWPRRGRSHLRRRDGLCLRRCGCAWKIRVRVKRHRRLHGDPCSCGRRRHRHRRRRQGISVSRRLHHHALPQARHRAVQSHGRRSRGLHQDCHPVRRRWEALGLCPLSRSVRKRPRGRALQAIGRRHRGPRRRAPAVRRPDAIRRRVRRCPRLRPRRRP